MLLQGRSCFCINYFNRGGHHATNTTDICQGKGVDQRQVVQALYGHLPIHPFVHVYMHHRSLTTCVYVLFNKLLLQLSHNHNPPSIISSSSISFPPQTPCMFFLLSVLPASSLATTPFQCHPYPVIGCQATRLSLQ